MNTRRLEESTRLVGATSWAAIVTGVFLALAVQAVLMWFGLALAQSSGDRVPGRGFEVWAVIVQLVAIAFGAAVAASISRNERRGGVATGIMVWAVALVLGGIVTGMAMATRFPGGAAWSAFLGALLGLAAAIIGGWFGASFRGPASEPTVRPPPETTDYTAHPVH
jgi:hypothetical protein